MEIKAQIEYTNDKERMDFIVEYNHRQGYDIRYSTRTETVERTRDVLEFDIVDGEEVPVMVEETYTEIEPQYDEEGNYTGDVEVEKTRLVQKSHEETYSEDVTINIIEAWGLTEEEKQEQEKVRINNLTMTALDFIGVLQSFGLTLEEINAYLESNLAVKMQLTYCQNVYCGVVKSFLPLTIGEVEITTEMIEQAFKIKNKFEEEKFK